MNSTIIQKYSKKSIPQLIEIATKKFNTFIRSRDEGRPCISCNLFTSLQAGHFYSGGHYPALRFNEDNVNGQCMRCNYYLSGDLNNYRKNLIEKIGIERVEKLDMLADYHKKHGFKWERFNILEVILRY